MNRINKRMPGCVRNCLWAILCGPFLLCGCSGRSETARIQELRDSIAALNDSVPAVANESHDNRPNQDEAKNKWVGEYLTMDDMARMWTIELHDDETAVAKCEETGRSFYGSWRIEKMLGNEPNVDFSKPYPDIAFRNGGSRCFTLYFCAGYIYPTYKAARAKNPDNRLGLLEDI